VSQLFRLRSSVDSHPHWSYQRGNKVAGIICLHDVSQKRISLSIEFLEMLKGICSNDDFSKVILVTTMGQKLPKVDKEQNVEALKNHWKPMLDQGSKTDHFEDTCISAWKIIRRVVENNSVFDAVPKLTVQPEGCTIKPMNSFFQRIRKFFGFR
jgi:hypothetical protein